MTKLLLLLLAQNIQYCAYDPWGHRIGCWPDREYCLWIARLNDGDCFAVDLRAPSRLEKEDD